MNKRINKTELNRLRAHINKNKEYLDENHNNIGDDDKKHSIALSMAVLIDYLGLNQSIAFDSITDNSEDNKIDAFYYNDDEDELNELVIVQAKYKNTDGETSTFDEDEIKLVINSCKTILNGNNFQKANEKLKTKLNDYRKLLSDNGNPTILIKLFFVTNGIIHEGHKVLDEVKECSKNSINPYFIDATEYGSSAELKDGELEINIKSEEDHTDNIFNYSYGQDIHLGKIVSCNILSLMKFYEETGGKTLLNNNVRYKVKNSSVNKDIIKSFKTNPQQFCFLNNGITMVCEMFKILPTGTTINKINLTKPSIINGGQTISALFELYDNNYEKYKEEFKNANIIIRIFQVPTKYILDIAKATNSQNPINVVDLHSNDKAQEIVKKYFSKHGIGMLSKVGEDVTFFDDTITNENLLQIYASLYGNDPAKAKLSKRSTFKQFYHEVFNEETNEEVCKKLYRCYEISSYIMSNETKDNKAILSNAFYSIIYTMKNKNNNVNNQNIPSAQINEHFVNAYNASMPILEQIIEYKQQELKTKFSLNNLFKSKEIKDLIDLKLEESINSNN